MFRALSESAVDSCQTETIDNIVSQSERDPLWDPQSPTL